MGKYFGTDGFRGEANVNLTVEHAYKVGRFLGWYYGKQAKKTSDNPAAVALPLARTPAAAATCSSIPW